MTIESKERAVDLEIDVGTGLINYIAHLMDFVPSVERRVAGSSGGWHISEQSIDFDDYRAISAAAYLKNTALSPARVFEHSNCDMLFVMDPVGCGWEINIFTNTRDAEVLKNFIIDAVSKSGNRDIRIR